MEGSLHDWRMLEILMLRIFESKSTLDHVPALKLEKMGIRYYAIECDLAEPKDQYHKLVKADKICIAPHMLEKPDLPDQLILKAVHEEYDLDLSSVTFLPLGYDINTAVYRVDTSSGSAYFLKLRKWRL